MIDFNATALKSFDDGANYLEEFVKVIVLTGFLELSFPMLFQT
jgi:hypothetical protein